jgi:glucose/arabinose dehydrogenase
MIPIINSKPIRFYLFYLSAMLGFLLGCVALAVPQAASQTVEVQVPEGLNSEPFDMQRELTVPPRFAIEVLARVDGARFLAVAPNGDILVSQPEAGTVTLVRPQESGAPETFELITGLLMPHDMVFHTLDDTTYLYVAAADQVVRYPYEEGTTSLTEGETIVTGLPTEPLEGEDNYRHPLKSIALYEDTLYVMIASSSQNAVLFILIARVRPTKKRRVAPFLPTAFATPKV